jgi:hypothetical protein
MERTAEIGELGPGVLGQGRQDKTAGEDSVERTIVGGKRRQNDPNMTGQES